MKCYNCKEIIKDKQYCLYINNKKIKPKISICTHCYMIHYFTKPYLFRKHHPEILPTNS